jgi:hypothetical protein
VEYFPFVASPEFVEGSNHARAIFNGPTGEIYNVRNHLPVINLPFPPALSHRAYSDLLYDLHEVFPDREVDLSFINHADPLFLKKIVENCRILFGAPRQLQSLKIYAFKRYQDHRRYFQMEEAYVKRFLKKTGAAT